MKKELNRPTAVFVLGILNIIFGSLGSMLYCCGTGGFLIGIYFINQAPANEPAIADLKLIMEIYQRNIPGIAIFLIVSMVASLILSVILLTSGIGLINMKRWARTMAFVYAGFAILLQLGSMGYQFTVMRVGAEKANQEILEKVDQAGKGTLGPNNNNNPFASNPVGDIIGGILNMALAIANIVILIQPHVVQAFANPHKSSSSGYGGDDDYGDFQRDPYPPGGDSPGPGGYPPQQGY